MDVRTLEGTVFRGWDVKNAIGSGADGIVYLKKRGLIYYLHQHSRNKSVPPWDRGGLF